MVYFFFYFTEQNENQQKRKEKRKEKKKLTHTHRVLNLEIEKLSKFHESKNKPNGNIGLPLKLNANNCISYQICQISAMLIFRVKLTALNT